LVAILCIGGALSPPAMAQAGDPGGSTLRGNQIMFLVKSNHRNVIDVAFYADGRTHSWPGNSRVYTIRNDDVHRYVLNCIRGERICYGAGVRNNYKRYWGVGIGNRTRCQTCCYRCLGQRTSVIVLNP
jgi:hypothetical protein